MQARPEDVYVRTPWVLERYSLSQSTLWRHIRGGEFPAPLYMPGGGKVWLRSTLLEWEATLGTQATRNPRAARAAR